jgi:hypothetical protein
MEGVGMAHPGTRLRRQKMMMMNLLPLSMLYHYCTSVELEWFGPQVETVGQCDTVGYHEQRATEFTEKE